MMTMTTTIADALRVFVMYEYDLFQATICYCTAGKPLDRITVKA